MAQKYVINSHLIAMFLKLAFLLTHDLSSPSFLATLYSVTYGVYAVVSLKSNQKVLGHYCTGVCYGQFSIVSFRACSCVRLKMTFLLQ